MRIGFIATRLSGTDGVSLEVEKWAQVLQRLGHEIAYCAGELGGYAANGTLVAEMHFQDAAVLRLNRAAFGHGAAVPAEKILEEIEVLSMRLQRDLSAFIRENRIELLIAQNIFAIPMHLPLAHALTKVLAHSGLPCVAHHHDFYWERERFQTNIVPDFLETYFPPDLPGMQHVCINTIAQRRLLARRGLSSVVIPNVFDFTQIPSAAKQTSASFRQALGMAADEPLIIQPTRVIQRKGIELALELLSRMSLAQPVLTITHSAGDEGLAYWHWLQHEARMMGVKLKLVDRLVGEHSRQDQFSLADAYLNADLITYPSLYEGFGNALIEAVYYRRPVVINRYPVYNCDIRPLGFEFIELDGYVDDRSVELTNQVIHKRYPLADVTEHNFALAKKYFSMDVLQQKLEQVFAQYSP